MALQSSMTLSIIVNHRLWGLVACHGAGPHRLDQPTRSVCELMVQIFGSQVSLRMENVALQSRLTSRRALEKYMAAAEAFGISDPDRLFSERSVPRFAGRRWRGFPC
jgi:light-regulated signal transduction histidine kinase (bacteriophytochrome)